MALNDHPPKPGGTASRLARPGQALARAMKRQPLLAWTAILGLGLLAWLLLGEPLLEEAAGLEERTAALRQALPARTAAVAREQARLEAARAQARQAQGRAADLAPPDQERLQGEVARLAREQGLNLTAIAPLPPSSQGAYRRLACSLQAQGDLRAVAGFLQALAQAPDLLHPLAFSLSRAPGSPLLNLELRVAGLALEAR